MLRAASSATRTDISATRLLVSITCCRPSRIRSLCVATKSCTDRQPTRRFTPSMFFCKPLLSQVDPLVRGLLEATRQDRVGLGHGLQVLGRAAGQLLRLRA